MDAKWMRKVIYTMAGICAWSVGVAFASGPAGDPPAELLNFDEAMEVDANKVAAALGITPEEARRRINVEHHAGPIIERIRRENEDRLAGIYIEHVPLSRLVVRLTGYQARRAEFHQFGADQLEVAYELGADRTFAQLQGLVDANILSLSENFPGWQGGYVDERTSEVVIHVLKSKMIFSTADAEVELEDQFRVPVRIVQLDEPEQNRAVYGSGHLSYQSGLYVGECTGSFIVQTVTSRYRGLLTAGHCNPSNNMFHYRGIDGASYALTHVARSYTNSADVGWMLGRTGTSYGPWFYADAWRQVTGRRTRANTVVGSQVCKYGMNGGYGCGTVQSIAMSPGSICGPSGNHPCSSTFVRLHQAPQLCLGGDSGGPTFVSTIAMGVIKSSNPSAGTCTYTSLDYAYSDLGVQLLL